MNDIVAIPTVYKDVQFRSRLEARWAVLLDNLNIEWSYEIKTFRLADDLCYLPDFWLPALDSWIEIKGVYPTEEEERKAILLHKKTWCPVFICYGSLDRFFSGMLGYLSGDGRTMQKRVPSWWVTCPHCWKHFIGATIKEMTLFGNGEPIRSPCRCPRNYDRWDASVMSIAMSEASHHRFECQGPYIPRRYRRR